MKDSCDYFRNASASMNIFSDGKDWTCFWDIFAVWLNKEGRGQLPMDAEDLIASIFGDDQSGVEGFFSREWWYLGMSGTGKESVNGWVASKRYEKFLGLNFNDRTVKWTRILVDTLLEDR